MTNTEPNPIELVRERLDGGRKWQKGTLGDFLDPEASVCLEGACGVLPNISQRIAVRHLLEQVVTDQFRDRLTGRTLMSGVILPVFNDHPETVIADLDLAFDKASVAWTERIEP